MPRIAGIDVPNDKPIWIALTYVHGIGQHLSKQILKEAQIVDTVKARELTDDELSRIAGILDRDYVVEGQNLIPFIISFALGIIIGLYTPMM